MTADQNSAPHRRRAARVLTPALLAVVVVAGCGNSPKELEELKAEPMASAQFDGLKLIRSDERDAKDSDDTITGKTVDALITRIFVPDDPKKLPEYFNQVVEQAVGDGWVKEFALDSNYTGEKAVDDRTGQIRVMLFPCNDQTCLYLYLTVL